MGYVKHKVSRLFHTLKHKLHPNNISIFSFCLAKNTAHLRYISQVGDIVNESDVCLLINHINAHLGHMAMLFEFKVNRVYNYRSSSTG